MNIVVLAGGLSTERDVSFVSGGKVCDALRSKGHKVLLLDVFMGYGDEECDVADIFQHTEEARVKPAKISSQAPDIKAVRASRKDQSNSFFGPNVIAICKLADIVFLALHGENGENGKVQAAFDLHGIRYTGNGNLGCAVAMDKEVTKLFLRDAGVPYPKGIALKIGDRAEGSFRSQIAYPCVVKPACGGSSIGVSIVEEEAELDAALDEAFRWEDNILIEQYVKGREFSVGVVDKKVLPIIEIAPKEGFYDYENKYKPGATVDTCPAQISDDATKRMQSYALKASLALHLPIYSRIDFLMDADENIFCLEANTLPGMTPTSLLPQEAAVLGRDFASLCEDIIRISLEKNNE